MLKATAPLVFVFGHLYTGYPERDTRGLKISFLTADLTSSLSDVLNVQVELVGCQVVCSSPARNEYNPNNI
jgi:hypothetical protein